MGRSELNLGDIVVYILGLLLASWLFDCSGDHKRDPEHEKYIAGKVKVEMIEKQIKVLEIENLKLQRTSDSLQKIIKNHSNEKIRIKQVFAKQRDSITTLPIDNSIDFFTRNIPQESINR